MTSERQLLFAVCMLSAVASVASATAGTLPDPVLIDDLQYPDNGAAQAAWEPMTGSFPVSMEMTGGRKSLHMVCNFKGTTMERASWDRKVSLDLASCTGIQFQLLNTLSLAYKNLSDDRKKELLDTVAGALQASRLAIVLKDLSKAQALEVDSLMDFNRADIENKRRRDTMERDLESLKTAWGSL